MEEWKIVVGVALLAIFGFTLGMDKSHDWRDVIGPIIMLFAAGAGAWPGRGRLWPRTVGQRAADPVGAADGVAADPVQLCRAQAGHGHCRIAAIHQPDAAVCLRGSCLFRTVRPLAHGGIRIDLDGTRALFLQRAGSGQGAPQGGYCGGCIGHIHVVIKQGVFGKALFDDMRHQVDEGIPVVICIQ